MLKVDLNFKKLSDHIKHPELALDHSKPHLFLAGTLTSIDLVCEVDETTCQAKSI